MPRQVTIYNWPALIFLLRSEQFLSVSQQGLAALLDVSLSTISNWETGSTAPQMKYRRKVMKLAEKAGFTCNLWPKKEQTKPRSVPSIPAK